MTPQLGPSHTDDSRVVIYDRNMFMIQATGHIFDIVQLTLFITDIKYIPIKQIATHSWSLFTTLHVFFLTYEWAL